MVEKIEDLNLPAAIVGRLIKEALPEGSIVAKEARNALTRAASVFVLYLTGASTEAAQEKNQKTISAQHVLTALKEIEFESFVEPLEQQLEGNDWSYKLESRNNHNHFFSIPQESQRKEGEEG